MYAVEKKVKAAHEAGLAADNVIRDCSLLATNDELPKAVRDLALEVAHVGRALRGEAESAFATALKKA